MNTTYSEVQNTQKVFWTKKRKNIAFIISLLALPITGFLVFWLYLNVSSLALAFQNELTGEFTLENFGTFFENVKRDWGRGEGIKIAVENTFISAAVRMFFAIPFVIIVSYVLFKKFYGHMFFRIKFKRRIKIFTLPRTLKNRLQSSSFPVRTRLACIRCPLRLTRSKKSLKFK